MHSEQALLAARDAALDEIRDLFAFAVQSDCENGVRWLNERAASLYLADFPATLGAIRQMQEIIDRLEDRSDQQ